MVGNLGTWRIPPGFWSVVLVTITVIMLCLAAGCMSSSGNAKSPGNSASPGNSGADNGGSGGSNSGGGTGSSGNPQYAYFTFNCKGSWTDRDISDGSKNHHGTFTMTGTMPFTLDYPWDNDVGMALYSNDEASGAALGSPLQVKSEAWDGALCRGTDCKPCHWTWEGEVGANGFMQYKDRKWTVSFMRGPLTTEGYRTISVTQDSPDCEAEYNRKDFVYTDLYGPATDCITSSNVPFDFSTGSGFDLPAHTPGYAWDSFASRVTFSRGKAPS